MDSGEQLKTLTSPELIGPNDRFGFNFYKFVVEKDYELIEDDSDLQPIDKQLEQLEDISAFVDKQLEEPHRSIIHLRIDEDLTIAEIARRLGLNPNTTYKYLAQSIQKIRNHFNH